MKAVRLICAVTAVCGGSWALAAEAADSITRPALKTPQGVALLVNRDDAILTGSSKDLPVVQKPDAVAVKRIASMADEALSALAERSSPEDTQYFEDGIWHSPNLNPKTGWMFGAGPAGLAAALWQYNNAHNTGTPERQEWLRKVSIETFDRALRDHQQPDGQISDLGSHREFLTVDFALAYITFQDTLDPDTRERWLQAIGAQVEFCLKSGELPNPAMPGWKATSGWYTNGNVELAQAAWLYYVWKATGNEKYRRLYELQWQATLRPSQDRWKGYGLYYLKEGTAPDGSDSSGFLTEAEALPGFDREYGMLQLSTAARLYSHSRDPRVLKLMNLLANSLLPHLDRSTMVLDATYGSRHSVMTPFCTCGPATLAWLGGREDLVPMLPDVQEKAFKDALLETAKRNNGNPGSYRSYGYDLAALLHAAMLADSAQTR